jgi:hypothetical protein
MLDLILRFCKWFADVPPGRLTQRWLGPGSIIALVVILIVAINTITGSREETQAAPGSGALSPDTSNLPYDFQFIGQGRITAGSEEVWVIGGIPIHVEDRTQLMSTFHVGDFVSLSGRILDSDIWLADRIELSEEKSSHYTFNSPLDWVRGSIWRIGGHSLFVGLGTELGTNLASSEVLLATFTVHESGAWQALEIRAFDPVVFEPTPTSSPTLTPTDSMRKVSPTSTIMPASGERNDGGDDEYEYKDEDDHEEKHSDDKRDEKDKGEHDDDDDDKHDDKDEGKQEDDHDRDDDD